MRQQTKPFIIERKPSRKLKADTAKPTIWGNLDADIAQGLRNLRELEQRVSDQAVATGEADRT
ncbi:MAG: hypothetical protein ACOVOA_04140 [Allorhizobium sp.]